MNAGVSVGPLEAPHRSDRGRGVRAPIKEGMGMAFRKGTPRRLLVLVFAGMAFWALPAAAQAKTIKVPATGSTTTIQEAINAASPGDTVAVASGTYSGPTVSVTKSKLTITGRASAIIDA